MKHGSSRELFLIVPFSFCKQSACYQFSQQSAPQMWPEPSHWPWNYSANCGSDYLCWCPFIRCQVIQYWYWCSFVSLDWQNSESYDSHVRLWWFLVFWNRPCWHSCTGLLWFRCQRKCVPCPWHQNMFLLLLAVW